MGFELFPDQKEALARIQERYEETQGQGRGLVVACTGYGKTILFNALIGWYLQEHTAPVLIVAHRDELLEQAREKYHRVDPSAIIGKVGGGVHEWGGQITVAGIDTISLPRHLKQLKQFGYGLVIVDECHHAASASYVSVLDALQDAFQLGVTATPDRLDKKSIETRFGKPVYSMSIVEAVQKKRLCNLKAIAIQTQINLDNVKRNRSGEYDEQELERAVDTPVRNQLIVKKYQELADGKRAVAFCVTVAHAMSLAYTFNDQGIASEVITGETPLPERARLFKLYRIGEIKVLCNVMVLTEGWDEPLAEVAIMARPTQSRGLYTQCVGRVLRLAPGKDCAIILDLTDNTSRHSLTAPVRLKEVLGLSLRDDETVEEALAREASEAEAREKLIRKLTETRKKDVEVNVLGKLEWKQQGDMFVLEVGLHKHRIALIPSKQVDGMWDVWARLAPTFSGQKWMGAQPLDWCQSFAERRARTLQGDFKSVKLLDKNADWRKQPVDPDSPQVKMAKWRGVDWQRATTKGELSDWIDQRIAAKEQEKAAKLARSRAKESSQVG